MTLSPPLALELVGHVRDDVVLLGVHGHDAAVLGNLGKDAPEVAVRHPNGAEGREDLEAGGAVLDRLADLADGLRRDLTGQDVMKGEVGVRVATEDGTAPLDRLCDRHPRSSRIRREGEIAREVDDRRHPAEGGGPAGSFGGLRHHVRVSRPRFGHRNIDVGMGLDSTRDDDLAACIDDSSGAAGQRSRPAERRDPLALDANVELGRTLRRHHLAPGDHKIQHRPTSHARRTSAACRRR